MAERKPVAVVKAQLPAGKATPGQQLGGALGPHGVNIGAFIKQFNNNNYFYNNKQFYNMQF